MSSVADDSSVDESVSSVGPDGWEAIDRLHDDDSDDSAEPFSRLATPVIDELQQSAPLTPAESLDDEETARDQDIDTLETPLATTHQEKEPDVSILWQGQEISFAEKSDGSASGQQDVTCSWADVRGSTAQSLLENSTWAHLDKVHGSLKMKLASKTLALRRPLKLFYVGSAEHQGEIEAKIGSALYAGADEVPRPRRRSIMPVSLDKESPQVALVPDFGTKMDIETCVDAQHVHDGQESIMISMDSGTSFKSSYDKDSKSYNVTRPDELPDLAVIQIPDDETQDKSLRLRARVFLNRHSIPTIIITASRQWSNRPLTIDTRSPHFVLHVPGATISESAVLRRLPVDTNTFVSINSLQLNRSLACMLADSPSRGHRPKLSKVLSLSNDQSVNALSPVKHTLVLLSIIVTLCAIGRSFLPRPAFSVLETATNVPIAQTPAIAPSIASTASIVPATSLASVLSKSLSAQQEKALVHVPEAADFDVEVLGDSVVLVKPPRWVLEARRAPKLDFIVSKNDKQLDINVSQISNTKVFALHLPWESAYGQVNVQIRGSAGSVRVNQSERVDFGSSYWKMWFRQKKTSEQLDDETAENEESSDRAYEPKDRLVEDVQALGRELSNLGKVLSQKVKDTLALSHDERLRVRQQRRQAREEKIKEIVRRVNYGKDEVFRSMVGEVRRWTENVSEYKRTHFREQQKDLLKLWWRVSGGPKDKRREEGNEHSKAKTVR